MQAILPIARILEMLCFRNNHPSMHFLHLPDWIALSFRSPGIGDRSVVGARRCGFQPFKGAPDGIGDGGTGGGDALALARAEAG